MSRQRAITVKTHSLGGEKPPRRPTRDVPQPPQPQAKLSSIIVPDTSSENIDEEEVATSPSSLPKELVVQRLKETERKLEESNAMGQELFQDHIKMRQAAEERQSELESEVKSLSTGVQVANETIRKLKLENAYLEAKCSEAEKPKTLPSEDNDTGSKENKELWYEAELSKVRRKNDDSRLRLINAMEGWMNLMFVSRCYTKWCRFGEVKKKQQQLQSKESLGREGHKSKSQPCDCCSSVWFGIVSRLKSVTFRRADRSKNASESPDGESFLNTELPYKGLSPE